MVTSTFRNFVKLFMKNIDKMMKKFSAKICLRCVKIFSLIQKYFFHYLSERANLAFLTTNNTILVLVYILRAHYLGTTTDYESNKQIFKNLSDPPTKLYKYSTLTLPLYYNPNYSMVILVTLTTSFLRNIIQIHFLTLKCFALDLGFFFLMLQFLMEDHLFWISHILNGQLILLIWNCSLMNFHVEFKINK